MQRRCANCHGRVFLVRAEIKLSHPTLPDETIIAFGLGTWHCENRCPQRTALVKVYAGPGKEADRGSGVRGHNLIHQLDVADDVVEERERRRPIRVEYGHPTSLKAKGANA